MDLASIRRQAEDTGVNPDTIPGMSKADLIVAIQRAEGVAACYASKTDGCRYQACSWRTDCYAEAKRRAN
jgi:hypothetical protein